jgi:hypothetical protein
MVGLKAPIPGTGWRCEICHNSADGAVAIICNNCIDKIKKTAEHSKEWANEFDTKLLRYVIRGVPMAGEIQSVEGLEEFRCDPIKHAIIEQKELKKAKGQLN